MIKQIAALVILSLLITVTVVYDQMAIQYLILAHDWVAQFLKDIFSVGQVSNISRQLIALLALPLAAGTLAAVAYYLVKRNWFPYFMEVVWVIWLIQVGAIVTMYGG